MEINQNFRILKEFAWFEWFDPSPIEPFNPGPGLLVPEGLVVLRVEPIEFVRSELLGRRRGSLLVLEGLVILRIEPMSFLTFILTVGQFLANLRGSFSAVLKPNFASEY